MSGNVGLSDVRGRRGVKARIKFLITLPSYPSQPPAEPEADTFERVKPVLRRKAAEGPPWDRTTYVCGCSWRGLVAHRAQIPPMTTTDDDAFERYRKSNNNNKLSAELEGTSTTTTRMKVARASVLHTLHIDWDRS